MSSYLVSPSSAYLLHKSLNACSLTAPAANSIMNLLQKVGYTGYSDLNNALNSALQALETAKNSGKSFVEEPGAQRVGDCIEAVSKLDDELNKAGSWINKQNEK